MIFSAIVQFVLVINIIHELTTECKINKIVYLTMFYIIFTVLVILFKW